MELLVTNPYGKAKRILKLRALDPRGGEPQNLLWGNFIHQMLEDWVRVGQGSFTGLEALARQRLESLDLSVAERSIWQVHLRHTLDRFWTFNAPYLNDESEVEIKGSFSIGGMVLAGKADRLVRLQGGRQGLLHIIDYKTGGGATAAQQSVGKSQPRF